MPNNLTDAEENRLLDLSLIDGDLLALLSTAGSDSASGTEVAGGSYARMPLDWDAASSSVKATAADAEFQAMPATDVQGWAIYDAAGTNRKWHGLLNRRLATAQATGDTITTPAHGLADGAKVVFGSPVPTGLTAATTYFVRDSTTNTFKVAATLGGSAVDITADAAGVVVGEVLEVPDGTTVRIAAADLTCSLA